MLTNSSKLRIYFKLNRILRVFTFSPCLQTENFKLLHKQNSTHLSFKFECVREFQLIKQ